MMSTPGIIIIGVCIALSMFIGFAIATTPSSSLQSDQLENLLCDELSEFQYKCDRPVIDPETEQPVTCQPDNSVILNCMVADGVLCEGLMNSSRIFEKSVDNACDYDAHLDYSTALLLSIFLGLFGVDRIYLGYYATGLFKMFSMGGLCIFWLVDIVLIALQVLLPSDGTFYRMPYYGPRVEPVRFDPVLTNYSVYSCVDCM